MTARAELIEAARLLLAAHRDVEAVELLMEPDRTEDGICSVLLQQLTASSPQPTARVMAAMALATSRPGDPGLLRQLGATAFFADDFHVASQAFEHLSRLTEDASDILAAAQAAYLDNDFDRAERLYGDAPQDSRPVACGLADIAIARGERDRAGSLLRRALESNPGSTEILATLVRLDGNADAVAGLERVIDAVAPPPFDRLTAAYALAGWADARRLPEEAMRYAAVANGLSRQQAPPYDPKADRAAAETMCSLFSETEDVPSGRDQGPRPVVIVGMPRSGTSLVESLLSAHPDVAAGGERMDLAMIGRELEIVAAQGGLGSALDTLRRRGAAFRKQVFGRLSASNLAGGIFTDKLPQNSLYLGPIARVFPEARFIHVRRDPREIALSMYLLNFASAYPYATDLDELIVAIRQHENLMARWSALLGPRLLEVRLEDLTADPRKEGRRLYEFCGLRWSDDYVAVENRAAPTNTFSALQVKREIRAPERRWPAYSRWVPSLLQAFGDKESQPVASGLADLRPQ